MGFGEIIIFNLSIEFGYHLRHRAFVAIALSFKVASHRSRREQSQPYQSVTVYNIVNSNNLFALKFCLNLHKL